MTPDVITFSAAISACEKGGQWQRALALLDEMRAARVTPDVITFSAAISACARASQPDQAMRLWSEVRTSSSLVPDIVAFNAILDAVVCWPHKACELWKLGLECGVYSVNYPYLHRTAGRTTCVLDLHHLSEGAAEAAIRWLFDDKLSRCNSGLSLAVISPDDTPVDGVQLITGWGRSRKVTSHGDVRARAIATLDHLGLAMLPTRNPGTLEIPAVFDAPPFQIQFRDLHGKHGTLDGVCCNDAASAVLRRIAAKLGVSEEVATSNLRLLKEGKELEPKAACRLRKGDTVHVMAGLLGGLPIREVESARGAALTDAPGATSSDDDDAKQLEPGAACLLAKGDTVHAVGGLEGGIGHRDVASASGAGRADGDGATFVESKDQGASDAASVREVAGDEHVALRCEVALSAMCRAMTELTNGRLCIAGSYALHRYLCVHLHRAPAWTPGDIDVFYCPSSHELEVDGGLEKDELRRRLADLARCCQAEMCGTGESGGFQQRTATCYPAIVERDSDEDAEDAACVAAFAREQLVSLCSCERPRAREYALDLGAHNQRPRLGSVAHTRSCAPAGTRSARAPSSSTLPHATTGLPSSTSSRWPSSASLLPALLATGLLLPCSPVLTSYRAKSRTLAARTRG